MRIVFVIHGLSVSGGIRVVFEYANQLRLKGHKVAIVAPIGPIRDVLASVTFKERFKNRLRVMFSKPSVDWFSVKTPIKSVPSLSEKYIPNADAIIATWWKTAEWVNTYSPNKGEKFYLVQGYEIWGGPREKVISTYKMPLKKIAVSSWIKEMLGRIGEESYGPILNGVNFNQFYNENKVVHNPIRIGMLYSQTNLKGSGDGVRAFEIAKKKYPDIKLVMYGRSWPGLEVPEDTEFHYNPPQEKLRDIYSSCDIWISPSWYEGFGLPAAEAMACKCAVISTDTGAIREYALPGETALISPPRDPEALAQELITLLDDREKLERISFAGYSKIREFTWERATEQLEAFLISRNWKK